MTFQWRHATKALRTRQSQKLTSYSQINETIRTTGGMDHD